MKFFVRRLSVVGILQMIAAIVCPVQFPNYATEYIKTFAKRSLRGNGSFGPPTVAFYAVQLNPPVSILVAFVLERNMFALDRD